MTGPNPTVTAHAGETRMTSPNPSDDRTAGEAP
jgi:hypothetical protein